MKALVTGGAGFIASHVVDGYLERGLDVAIVDDLSRGSMNNVNPKARFYKADIRDFDAMREIFGKERPDCINHHAAQMDLRRAVFGKFRVTPPESDQKPPAAERGRR